MAMAADHYGTLKITADADDVVVKAAYRALMLKHHPDHNPGRASAAAQAQRINEAYEVLRDPARRAAYDQSLAARPVPPGRPQAEAWDGFRNGAGGGQGFGAAPGPSPGLESRDWFEDQAPRMGEARSPGRSTPIRLLLRLVKPAAVLGLLAGAVFAVGKIPLARVPTMGALAARASLMLDRLGLHDVLALSPEKQFAALTQAVAGTSPNDARSSGDVIRIPQRLQAHPVNPDGWPSPPASKRPTSPHERSRRDSASIAP